MILRPPEYLEDVHERELEVQASEARLYQLDQSLCPHCDYRVERDFIRCPSCLRKLKDRCASCSRPLERAWTICPYCEADVPGLATPRSRRRRAAALDTELSEIASPDTIVSEDAAAEDVEPVAASEPTTRRRAAGRSTRPSGRPRPSS
jgi:uncharacterized Zn finger protein (UPF0148 family)